MRRLLVQVLFYSIAVAATVALLSLVSVPTPGHPEGVPLLTHPVARRTASRVSTSRSGRSS